MTHKTPGRKAIDGARGVTKRVNVVLTQHHRDRLEKIAPEGFSAWVRSAIDKAWNEYTKETMK